MVPGKLICVGIAPLFLGGLYSSSSPEQVLDLLCRQRTQWDETVKQWIEVRQTHQGVKLVKMVLNAPWPLTPRIAVLAMTCGSDQLGAWAVSCSVTDPEIIREMQIPKDMQIATVDYWMLRLDKDGSCSLCLNMDLGGYVPQFVLNTAASVYPTLISDVRKLLVARKNLNSNLQENVPAIAPPTSTLDQETFSSKQIILLSLLIIFLVLLSSEAIGLPLSLFVCLITMPRSLWNQIMNHPMTYKLFRMLILLSSLTLFFSLVFSLHILLSIFISLVLFALSLD
jgi:hypothetical protein